MADISGRIGCGPRGCAPDNNGGNRHCGEWFLLLAVVLSWLFWLPAALFARTWPAFLLRALHYLGGLGPTVAAIGLVSLREGQNERRCYWRRIIDARRIRGGWWLAMLLLIPALTGLGALLDVALGGQGARAEEAARFLRRPFALLPYVLFLLLFGPLPEEMGWRGYGQDRLQRHWGPLSASLIVGAVWTAWHLPLFFLPGTYQEGLGVGTPRFWLFMLDKVPQSVLMTWIYNHTHHSTLSAILFHLAVNLTGQLFDLTVQAEAFYITLTWVMAGIVSTYGTFRRRGLRSPSTYS
ncbi:MAG: CPBP family intramembrane metalloprotease [Chloroflexi bacterium]|nr:CPBP family intramembrane metalloprotease [Chloroflexota bacterium]